MSGRANEIRVFLVFFGESCGAVGLFHSPELPPSAPGSRCPPHLPARLGGTGDCSHFTQCLSTFGLIWDSKDPCRINPSSIQKNCVCHLENYCQSSVWRRRCCSKPCISSKEKPLCSSGHYQTSAPQWSKGMGKKLALICWDTLFTLWLPLQVRCCVCTLWAAVWGVVCQRRRGWRDTASWPESSDILIKAGGTAHQLHFTSDPQTWSSAPHSIVLCWWERSTRRWFLSLLLLTGSAIAARKLCVKVMKD